MSGGRDRKGFGGGGLSHIVALDNRLGFGVRHRAVPLDDGIAELQCGRAEVNRVTEHVHVVRVVRRKRRAGWLGGVNEWVADVVNGKCVVKCRGTGGIGGYVVEVVVHVVKDVLSAAVPRRGTAFTGRKPRVLHDLRGSPGALAEVPTEANLAREVEAVTLIVRAHRGGLGDSHVVAGDSVVEIHSRVTILGVWRLVVVGGVVIFGLVGMRMVRSMVLVAV